MRALLYLQESERDADRGWKNACKSVWPASGWAEPWSGYVVGDERRQVKVLDAVSLPMLARGSARQREAEGGVCGDHTCAKGPNCANLNTRTVAERNNDDEGDGDRPVELDDGRTRRVHPNELSDQDPVI
jgi:hypothetical protein